MEELLQEIREARKQLERLTDLVDGNDTRDIIGLRRRVTSIENKVEQILKDKEALDNKVKGIMILVRLTGVTTIVGLFSAIVTLFAVAKLLGIIK